MNELGFGRALIRERNEELVRDVRAERIVKRLRTNRERRPRVWRLFEVRTRERKLPSAAR